MNSLMINSKAQESLQVLVVEDDLVFNMFYKSFLGSKNAEVVSCLSLAEARMVLSDPKLFFDAVILDNQLSDGEGISLLPDLNTLQSLAAVIMVSGNDDPEFFLTAFSAGIDDYMVKPVNLELLWLKMINAVNQLRLKDLSARQHAELAVWVEHEQQQQTLAKHLFDTLFLNIHKSHPAIHIWMQPSGVFSGDAMLRYKAKDGCWYFILADAMGHGLAPAVSLMPMMQSFQVMASKASPLSNIVYELNGTLNRLLPDDRFVAAILMRLNPWLHELEVWNGGMPTLQCLSADGQVMAVGKSSNMALGVLSNTQISLVTQLIPLRNINYLMMYSDGLTETVLPSGDTLHSHLLPTLLGLDQAQPLNNLCQLFSDVVAEDDISLCLIDCALLLAPQNCEVNKTSDCVGSFSADLRLHGYALVQVDVPAKVVDLLRAQNLPLEFLQRVFTVLSELFANALEHGVLGLDSKLKDQPDGFILFYEEKERRTASLSEQQFIEVRMQWSVSENTLIVDIKDSGAGFMPKIDHTHNEVHVHGRGLLLIKQLSRHFEVIAPGNHYHVVMSP